MSLESFAESRAFTLGVELELQIVNRHDYDLAPGAADLLRLTGRRKLAADVKPEITSSMIELSTGICEGHEDVITQLLEVRDALVQDAAKLNLRLCGGGTHAFQDWSHRRIFDTPRFRQVSELYGYLSKQFTVFGQHVHIGCTGPDQALWLLHAMSRFVPHVIALSASSPYIQGTDTGFQSARLNSVYAFPLSGRSPFVLTWQDFGTYFDKMRRTGVVESMKDFYWDIRPKPEFGTIEVRVMDTPLSVERAAAIAAYLQCVARWLWLERPFEPHEDDYLAYNYNRFQACRFGLDGEVVDPQTAEHRPLRELIAQTLVAVEQHAIELRAERGLTSLRAALGAADGSDAAWLRGVQSREQYLPEVVRPQCLRFEGA
jgi:carboxylate-amine ligase